MDSTLVLTRSELAKFLGNDQDLIIRFESLLESVGKDIPSFLDDVNISISVLESARSSSNAAINRLSKAIENLSLIPAQVERKKEDDITPPQIPARIPVQPSTVVYQCKALTAISKGNVIMLVGASSGVLSVQLFSPGIGENPNNCLGVASEDIAFGEIGSVVGIGEITGIDTSGFSVGDELYSYASGNITKVAPVKPESRVVIGNVITSSSSGTISVRVMVNSSIGRLDDVEISTPIAGNFLQYDAVDEVFKNVSGVQADTFSASDTRTLTITHGLITGIA